MSGNDSQNKQGGWQSRSRQERKEPRTDASFHASLTQECLTRMQNLAKIEGDIIELSMRSGIPPGRLENLRSGREAIDAGVATFLEDVLELPPGFLDRSEEDHEAIAEKEKVRSETTAKAKKEPEVTPPVTEAENVVATEPRKDLGMSGSPLLGFLSSVQVNQPAAQQAEPKPTAKSVAVVTEVAAKPVVAATQVSASAQSPSVLDIRRENIDLVTGYRRGLSAALCRKIGIGDSLISQIKAKKREVVDDLAAKIENAIGAAEGWLSVKQTAVPDSILVSLGIEERAPQTPAVVKASPVAVAPAVVAAAPVQQPVQQADTPVAPTKVIEAQPVAPKPAEEKAVVALTGSPVVDALVATVLARSNSGLISEKQAAAALVALLD